MISERLSAIFQIQQFKQKKYAKRINKHTRKIYRIFKSNEQRIMSKAQKY
jgi:hypothetical protein